MTMVPEHTSPGGAFPIGRDMDGLRVMDAPYLPGTPGDVSNTGVTNSPQTVAYPTAAGSRHVLETIHFSFSAAPAAGSYVEVLENGAQVFFAFITSGGPGPLCLSPALISALGADQVIILSAGGAGVIGSLTCRHYLVTDI